MRSTGSGLGPEDIRKSQLVAASAVARIDPKTAVAFGFADGAKAMERRLQGVASGGFLIAHDIAADPGFTAKRNGSIAIRRELGRTGLTLSAETGNVWQDIQTSATGSPYGWTSVAADRSIGRNWLSLGMSRLEEKRSLLGGHLSNVLGGGGSTSLFLDAEARHDFGKGLSAGLTARRGWTDFAAGKFQTGAYAFDLAKLGLLGEAAMLDPKRLRDPEAEPVVAAKHPQLGEVEPIGAGLELAAGEVGPAAPRGQRRAPAAAEIVPRLGIEEQRGRAAAAERHRSCGRRASDLLLVEPAEPELQPVRARSRRSTATLV